MSAVISELYCMCVNLLLDLTLDKTRKEPELYQN